MKKLYRPFLSLLTVSMLAVANLGYADDDKCINMAGSWNGNGTVKVLFFSCEYNVTANVQEGNPANATVRVKKTSGSFLCTNEATENVIVSCKNKFVEIKSERINISGTGSEDGMNVFLSGNIRVMSKDHPLDLELHKSKI